jgi:hypothetical protein
MSELWEALAALVVASAIFVGSVLALSSRISHQPPRTIDVYLSGPR